MPSHHSTSGSCVVLAGLVLALAIAGCGSDGTTTAKSQNADTKNDAQDAAQPECGVDSTQRCTDQYGLEVCPVDTGWPGDELAPCAPKEGEAMLLHYGPSDYDDPKEIEKYTLAAGGEDENCIYVRTPNDQEVFIGDYHGRMRPNSHHLIVTLVDSVDETVPFGEPVPCRQSGAVGSRWLLGSQDPQIDLVNGGPSLDVPAAKQGDPDYMPGTRLPANQILRIDMHYINATQEPLLKEAWVYLEIVPKAEVKTPVDMITFFQGAIDLPPGSKGVTTKVAKCVAPTDRYVGLVTGHFHENGTRFSIWHDTADGEHRQIYETYDWENPGNAYFMDRMDNPAADRNVNQWGAASGYVFVKKGEAISFQCEFDNPSDTPVTLGDKGKDQMCNVFGMYYPSDGDVWSCQCLGETCF